MQMIKLDVTFIKEEDGFILYNYSITSDLEKQICNDIIMRIPVEAINNMEVVDAIKNGDILLNITDNFNVKLVINLMNEAAKRIFEYYKEHQSYISRFVMIQK